VRQNRAIVSLEEPDSALQRLAAAVDQESAPAESTSTDPSKDEDIEQELARIYEADSASLHRYALALTQRHESAQDAVQEIFLRYYIARSEGQRFRNPRAWLFRVLRNHVYDGMRTIRSKNEVGIEGLRESADAGQDPEGDYRRAEISRHLTDSLAPRELECVRLRAEGLRYDEIAEVLSVRSGTVGAMLAHAHKKIRTSLRRAGYLEDTADETLGALSPEETPYAS
jgi:RNA polymerase sigma-70 factor (ECF subfamily)